MARFSPMKTHHLNLITLLLFQCFSCSKDHDCEVRQVTFDADFRHDLVDLQIDRGDTMRVVLEIEEQSVDQNGNAIYFESVAPHFFANLIQIKAHQENLLVRTPAFDPCFRIESSVAREGPPDLRRSAALLPEKMEGKWLLEVKLIPSMSGQFLFRWSMSHPANGMLHGSDPCAPVVRLNINHSEDNGLTDLFKIDSSLADEPALAGNHAALFFTVR